VPELRRVIGHIDQTRPIGVRDTAINLLGYAGALRRSELVALTLADVEHQTAGLLLTIRHSICVMATRRTRTRYSPLQLLQLLVERYGMYDVAEIVVPVLDEVAAHHEY
jgi:integrase